MDGLDYMNCGDWVESCTALTERHDGRIELVRWQEQTQAARPAAAKPVPELGIEDQAA